MVVEAPALNQLNLALKRRETSRPDAEVRRARKVGELQEASDAAINLWHMLAHTAFVKGEPRLYKSFRMEGLTYADIDITTKPVRVTGPEIPQDTALRLRGINFAINPEDKNYFGAFPDRGTVVLEAVNLDPANPDGEPLSTTPIVALRAVHQEGTESTNNYFFVDPDDIEQIVYPQDISPSNSVAEFSEGVEALLNIIRKGLDPTITSSYSPIST